MTTNVLAVGEEADLEARMFNLALKPLFCQTCVIRGFYSQFKI